MITVQLDTYKKTPGRRRAELECDLRKLAEIAVAREPE